MGHDPVGIDALVAASGLTAEAVSSMLLVLELRGYVSTFPGGRYSRIDARKPGVKPPNPHPAALFRNRIRTVAVNENVIDVLIYIYETYMDGDQPVPADHVLMQEELLEAGFKQGEIKKAFDWLDELAWTQGTLEYTADAAHGLDAHLHRGRDPEAGHGNPRHAAVPGAKRHARRLQPRDRDRARHGPGNRRADAPMTLSGSSCWCWSTSRARRPHSP